MKRFFLSVGSPRYLWVRWRLDSGHSSWHQLREDRVMLIRGLRTGALLDALRLRTRCGFDVPNAKGLEIWPGPFTPVGQTCVYCTRSFLVDTLPPLGTPPVPGRGHVRLVTGPRRKGSAQAPSALVDR